MKQVTYSKPEPTRANKFLQAVLIRKIEIMSSTSALDWQPLDVRALRKRKLVINRQQ